MAQCDYSKEVGNTPLTPAMAKDIMDVEYNPVFLKDNYRPYAGLDWFSNPNVSVELMGTDPRSQEVVLTYEDYQNPFDNVEYKDISTQYTGECPARLQLECGGCISTVPTYKRVTVRYDAQMRIGASWCPELKSLTLSDLDEQMTKRMNDFKIVSGVMAWNKLICEAKNSPASTVGREGETFTKHYIELNDARVEGVEAITAVISYFDAYFGDNSYRIFADRALEKDLVADALSSLHAYSENGHMSPAPQDDVLVQGGWRPIRALPNGIWGHQIYIAPDFISFYGGTGATPAAVNRNPFLSDDGSRYYVLFATQRSFYTGVVPVGDGHYYPTCENGIESVSKRWLSFNKILFPEEVLLLSFVRNKSLVDTGSNGGTTTKPGA